MCTFIILTHIKIQILDLLVMYFDAVVVFVMKFFNFTQIVLGHSVTRSKFGKCIPQQSQQQAKQSNKQTVVFQFWILPTKNQLMVFDCKSCDQIMTLTKWVFQVLWLALLQSGRKKWGWRDFNPPSPNFEGSEKRRRNRKPITIYSTGFENLTTALLIVTPIIKLNLVVEQSKKKNWAGLAPRSRSS